MADHVIVVDDITAIPYRVPFRQPVQTARGLWTEQHGVLLRCVTTSGATGLGEFATGPNAFRLRPVDRQQWDTLLQERILGRELSQPEAERRLCEWVAQAPEMAGLIYALSCALESAFDDGDATGSCLASLLWVDEFDPPDRPTSWPPPEVEVVKLKLFGQPTDAERIARLRSQLGPAVSMRGDLNGARTAMPLDEYFAICQAAGLDWIEDPLGVDCGLDDWEALPRDLLVCADELFAHGRELPQRLDGVVVKPSRFPTWWHTRRAAEAALEARLDVYISHQFETAIGRTSALRLAVALGTETVAGLTSPLAADFALGPTLMRGRWVGPVKITSIAGSKLIEHSDQAPSSEEATSR